MTETPPAEGERRAIGGYASQYSVAADLILRALRAGQLQWIRLVDPTAGRVDDLQIGDHLRVDAYQVKWAAHPGTISFHNLTTVRWDRGRESPSLINQLAQGWMRLRQARPGTRIVVHLVTDDHPSVDDAVPASDPVPTSRHLAAFLEQAWRPVVQGQVRDEHDLPAQWRYAWERLRDASGLGASDFMDFVQSCALDVDWRLPDEQATTRDEEIWLRDHHDLQAFIFRTVGSPERVIELTREQLLRRLGWTTRIEFRSRHDFPVDETLYRPVVATERDLTERLSHVTRGYLLLTGTPGSGKSTVLTQVLRSRQERVVRYYAYVPDAQDPAVLRGESLSFLHDITTALDRAGFVEGRSLAAPDRHQLLARFHRQLRALHDDWRATGRKTLILVDGLDHIAREQRPERSLLDDLPDPDQVPDGVIFLLGSQTDTPLSVRVRAQVSAQERRIEMRPLPRDAVLEIVERASLMCAPTSEQKENIFRLSGGHPLALVYLLNAVRDAPDCNHAQRVLDTAPPYAGNIEEQYRVYWDACLADSATADDIAHLLGLAARVRGSIDLTWIGAGDSATLQRLARTIAHYFRREDATRWYFFHNSFRLFLVERTAEGLDGRFDVSRDHGYHRELARRCAQEPEGSRLLWEEMYHRAVADDDAGVLDRATPALFRAQIASLRPIDAVQADIRLAFRTLAHASQSDPVVLTRLVLAGAEAGRAGYHLDGHLGTVSPARLLLQLGLCDEALEYARDGNRLRITARAALNLCQPLVDLARNTEAARLFELAEPLDLLSAAMVEDGGHGEKGETLAAWAEAAVLFLPIAAVIERSRHIRVSPGRHGLVGDPDATTAAIHARMLYHAGLSVLKARRWNDLGSVMDALAATQAAGAQLWFWLHVGAWRSAAADGDHDRARTLITETLGTVVAASLEPGDTVALAQGVSSVLEDAQHAQTLLDTVPQPSLATAPVSINAGFHPFEQRFALNWLRATLGDRRTPEQIVPDAEDPLYQGIVYVERAVCAVAAIWGAAWRREWLDGASIVRMAAPVLHLFEDPRAERQRWNGWYIAEGGRPQLSALLVHGAALHSAEARDAVLKAFEERWQNQPLTAWPVDVRRHVIVAAHEAGASAPWAEEQLRALDALVAVGLSGADLVDERQKQVEAWLDLGDLEAARAQLDALVVASFGLTPEDYQLSRWIAWLPPVNRADPAHAAERVSLCARTLVMIKDGVEGRVVADGAERLLRAACAWSPRRAVHLFRWCLDRGVAGQVGGVRALLRGVLDDGRVPADLVHAVLSAAVLATDSLPDDSLARALAEIEVPGEGPASMARVVDADVQLYALPVDRAEWRQGLARGLIARGIDLERAGFAPTDLRAPEESRPSERLALDDGTALDVDQVLARVTDLASLQELLARAANDTSFDWTPVVVAVAPTLDRTGVSALIERFDTGRAASRILAVLSERLSSLGDTAAAWEAGERALAASDPHGWGRWYDQGSRSAAYRAFVRADARRGRGRAFQTLCADLAADTYGWIGSFAPHLDEVLPIVTDSLPYTDIWVEIEHHLRAVTTPHGILPAGPSALDVSLPNDTPARALADVLLWHLGHPVQAVAQAAARAIGGLLVAGDADMVAEVDRALRHPDDDHMPILMILDAVSLTHADAATPFNDALGDLQASADYAERTVARTISERRGRAAPSPVAGTIATLPPVYRIALPPGGTGFYTDGAVVPGRPRPDSDDPMQIVRPFDSWVEAIAAAAALPAINVAHRVVQIMHMLAPREEWSAAGEHAVRQWLSEAGLCLTFRRPRSIVARRALRRAVAELIDAGTIAPDALYDVERRLRSYDSGLVLVRPATRPIEVGEVAGQGPYGIAGVNWAGRTSEAIDREHATASDGRIILANLATLCVHDRPQATEQRTNVVTAATADSAVPVFQRRLVTEYPTLGIEGTPLPLLIRHQAAEYESPGTDWVALNPAVGRALGWAVSGSGLFRWIDSDGHTMVESVWWVDGPPREAGTHGHAGETGTGWMVLATPDAWNGIMTRYGPMRRDLAVVRTVTDESGQEHHGHDSRVLPA